MDEFDPLPGDDGEFGFSTRSPLRFLFRAVIWLLQKATDAVAFVLQKPFNMLFGGPADRKPRDFFSEYTD